MALDEKGIYLSEVDKRYPRSFQTLGYDVLMDTDSTYKPKVISTFEMCVNTNIFLNRILGREKKLSKVWRAPCLSTH